MGDWWREVLGRRAWWMNALMFFSAYMAIVYLPFDFFFKEVAADEEVWFGIRLHGWAAKATEPLHWAIYAAGTYGFWRMRPWMWPWAAVYVAQVAIAMLVWNLVYVGGASGWAAGLVAGAAFGALAWVLFRSRDAFRSPHPSLRERYGEWALVTGASAGIGADFARALAREGVSCVLTARREERLRELADELEKTHAISTRIVAVDLSEPDAADRVADAVTDLEISILVNNAGVGYAGRFEKQDVDRLRAMVQLNCVAPVVLTARLLPGMRERGRGAVIVVGSVAGNQPLPLHGVYAATKAFDQLFGESLWGELRGSGVDVLVLQPGSTESEFHEVAGELPHWGEPSETVVAVALEALGQQPSVISGWFNYLRANAALRLLPRSTAALAAHAFTAKQTPPELQ
ncbi:MAG: SDR family oxidoreductase [Deltaproteobacteria bacterium]|nr:MAG: SDR family oxidoreductase [Deltaproteobacteria bacterium]